MDRLNGSSEAWEALGFEGAPRRVVSLVPSVTESLFDLGVGERLVGITDFCLYPANRVAALPRVGGPKTPDLNLIHALQPDLIIASREENRKEDVDALRAAGQKVWVTFPCTVRAALDMLWSMIQLFGVPQMGPRLSALETGIEWADLAAANMLPVKVFCPIWRDPPIGLPRWWMTFNRDTYTHDLLRLCGGENVFADRDRRYPLEADLADAAEVAEVGQVQPEPPGDRDTRYPRVGLAEVAARAPEIILLPSEPFAFTEADGAVFDACPDLPAVKNKRIYRVDGSLLTWPGIRLAKALAELPSLLQTGLTENS